MANEQVFGPLPLIFAQKLQQKIEEAGGTARIVVDADEVRELIAKTKIDNKNNKNLHPANFNLADNVYIEIPTNKLLLIKKDLMQLALWPTDETSEEFDAFSQPDFLCPICDHQGSEQGFCPQHKTRLLEYSSWRVAKKLVA